MASTERDRFAKLLMQLVRDQAIQDCDRLASGKITSVDGKRWSALLADDVACSIVRELIPDIVDRTLFQLLNAIDCLDLPVGWRTADGTLIDFDDIGLGEMTGWFVGVPGWRDQFSSERFFNPEADANPTPSDSR